MTKLKTPLLSMDAHGTLGKSITFQSGGGRKFVREKPVLPYSLTLAQQYQRWLYEDYCQLWHAQAEATKAEYREAGVRHHLTAFQYWMKYHLANLPDIAAGFRMDLIRGAAALDFSRNLNHGVVFGCVLADGVIDHSFLYDGVNDRVEIPHSPSVDLWDEFTIESHLWVDVTDDNGYVCAKQQMDAQGGFGVYFNSGLNKVTLYNGSIANISSNAVFTERGTWFHFAVRKTSAHVITFFKNGIPAGTGNLAISSNTIPLTIGRRTASLVSSNMFKGYQDHHVFYNRPLSDTDILRHAGRRYSV